MTSNYEILVQKFENFKKYIKEISKSPKVQIFESYSNAHYIGFSAILSKFQKEQKLKELVDKTMSDLEIDKQHYDKIMRYYLCFCEYIQLIEKPPMENNESKNNESKNDESSDSQSKKDNSTNESDDE